MTADECKLYLIIFDCYFWIDGIFVDELHYYNIRQVNFPRPIVTLRFVTTSQSRAGGDSLLKTLRDQGRHTSRLSIGLLSAWFAGSLAGNVRGVRSVKNDLIVR